MREPPADRIQNFQSKQILCKFLWNTFIKFSSCGRLQKGYAKCFIHSGVDTPWYQFIIIIIRHWTQYYTVQASHS